MCTPSPRMSDLLSVFLNPDNEYSPIPFWFWNDKLTKEEIIRQIRDFHSHGVARNSWWNEREYHDLLSSFSAAAQRVAQTRSIPCIDLHQFMMDFITAHGRDAVKNLFHIGDYTHTNDFGAYMAAGFIAAELKRQKIADTLAREPWPPHAPYDVPAQNQGDESLPPEGIEALYRSFEKRGDDMLTCAEALELVCRTFSLFSINVHTELPADVEPDAPYADHVRCALQNRLIPDHMLRDGRLHPCKEIEP